MPKTLHILTRGEDELALKIIASQRSEGAEAVKVFDLTEPNPDYVALLEAIFEAESVAVW